MGKETYQGVIGGGLKFKGDGVKKKKKKHSPKTQDDQKVDALSKAAAQTDPKGEEQTAEKASDVRSAEELNKLRESRMTESEKAFARARRERLLKEAGKSGVKSYEERKHEFAKQLAEAPEHNDMPKVGPG